MHLVHASVLAELLALVSGPNASDSAKLAFVAPMVKSTVSSILQEHFNVLAPLWFAMIVDAARILYSEQHSSSAASKDKAEVDMETLFGFTTDASAVGNTTATPNDKAASQLAEANPLRGGLTYSASAAAQGVSAQTASLNADIRAKLLAALPAALSAYIGTSVNPSKALLSSKSKSSSSAAASPASHPIPAIANSKVLPLFAVAQAALREALTYSRTSPIAVEELLSCLLTLARRDSPAYSAGKSFSAANSTAVGVHAIPAEEWVSVVRLLNLQFARVANEFTVPSVAELASVLSDRAIQLDSEADSPVVVAEALWCGLWRLSISLTNAYDGRLLVNFDPIGWNAAVAVGSPIVAAASSLATINRSSTDVTKCFNGASAQSLVKTLTKLGSLKGAVAPIVLNILALMLIPATVRDANNDDTDDKDRKALTELIVTSLVAKQSTGAASTHLPALCAQLLQNVYDLLLLTAQAFDSGAAGGDPGDAQLAHHILDISLAAWRVVALSVGDKVFILLISFVLVL